MVKITWFHPNDPVRVTAMRYGSKSAELFLHMSAKDIARLSKLGKSKQVRPARGLAFKWTGPFKILPKVLKRTPPRKPSKPKPAPPIPRLGLSVRTTSRVTHKVKKKSKKPRKLSAYNLFVQKHRLAGKDMKQIGAMWRKKKG